MPAVRPTKKQKLLLEYIESFIAEHGYSPSYREIMNGVGYTSVATVALHINNLVKRGHLIKRENSARSLEPTKAVVEQASAAVSAQDSAWLFSVIEQRLKNLETTFDAKNADELYVLIGSVKVLGFYDQAIAYITHLKKIEENVRAQ
jgi:repressor LexA